MGPQNGPTGSNQGPGFSWPIKMDKRPPDGTFLPGSGGQTKGTRLQTWP